MAWTLPSTRATGDLITASIWNTDLVNDITYLGSKVFLGSALTNPTGITSATFVMLGFGGTATVTPGASGRVRATFSGNLLSSVGNTNNFVKICAGTGTAPANGAAATGTSTNPTWEISPTSSTNRIPFSFDVVHPTTWTVGAAVWFDLAAEVSSGTLTLENCTVTLVEL